MYLSFCWSGHVSHSIWTQRPQLSRTAFSRCSLKVFVSVIFCSCFLFKQTFFRLGPDIRKWQVCPLPMHRMHCIPTWKINHWSHTTSKATLYLWKQLFGRLWHSFKIWGNIFTNHYLRTAVFCDSIIQCKLGVYLTGIRSDFFISFFSSGADLCHKQGWAHSNINDKNPCNGDD